MRRIASLAGVLALGAALCGCHLHAHFHIYLAPPEPEGGPTTPAPALTTRPASQPVVIDIEREADLDLREILRGLETNLGD